MALTEVNGILQELVSGMDRLKSQLEMANDFIDCLQEFRICLTDFNSKCDCVQNCDNKTYFLMLDNKYRRLIQARDANLLTRLNGDELSRMDGPQKALDINEMYVKSEANDVMIGEEMVIQGDNRVVECDCNDRHNSGPIRTAKCKGVDCMINDFQFGNRLVKRKPNDSSSKELTNCNPLAFTNLTNLEEVSVNVTDSVDCFKNDEDRDENEQFGDFEKSLFVTSDKLSPKTSLTKQEIIAMIDRDECIAKVDANHRYIKSNVN